MESILKNEGVIDPDEEDESQNEEEEDHDEVLLDQVIEEDFEGASDDAGLAKVYFAQVLA